MRLVYEGKRTKLQKGDRLSFHLENRTISVCRGIRVINLEEDHANPVGKIDFGIQRFAEAHRLVNFLCALSGLNWRLNRNEAHIAVFEITQ